MRPVTSGMYPNKGKASKHDRRSFSKTADRTHRLNVKVKPRRGGYRL